MTTDHFARQTERVGSRVANSAAILWATNMAVRVLQLLTTAVLARLLTPADYGVVALATMVTGLLDVLSNLQVGGSIIRTGRLEKAHLDTAFTLELLRGGATALVLVILASPAASALRQPELKSIFYVLAAMSALTCCSNPYFILLERDLDFRRESRRLVAASALGAVVGISTALTFRSYWALIASNSAVALFNCAFSYIGIPRRPGISVRKFRELFAFGSWTLLINVLTYVNSRIDYTLIGRNLGPRELGAYHIGQQTIITTTGDMVGPLGRAIFPAFAIVADDPIRLRRSYRRAQTTILALSLPIGFGVSVLGRDLILLLVGRQWLAAVPVVTVLAPLIALQTMNAGVDGLAYALGRTRALFFRTLAFLVVRAAAMIAGFSIDGFMGVIHARIFSGTFMLLYGLGLGSKLAGVRVVEPILDSWRSFASVAAMYLCLVSVPRFFEGDLLHVALATAMKVVLGVTVYGSLHLLLWKAAGSPDGAETSVLERVRPMMQAIILRGRRQRSDLRAHDPAVEIGGVTRNGQL